MKKRIISILLTVVILCAFGLCAMGSGESTTTEQGKDSAVKSSGNNLGSYNIEIKDCRLVKDYEGKDVIIINYGYTNNSDDATSFMVAVDAKAFQNDVGLNESYFLDDSANYNSDNQSKEVKKGATLDVEVAYELNDTTSDVVVEVSEFISFNDDVVTKTFTLS